MTKKHTYQSNGDELFTTPTQPTQIKAVANADAPYQKCYHTHPALPITYGNGEVGAQETALLYGGSCYTPVVKDADIYIGFDSGMNVPKHYPWDAPEGGPLQVLYPITDGSVPPNVEGFKRMLDWMAVQLIAGKKMHIGCIGGHGRTGLVMAALVTTMTGEKDSIAYVRKHYCEKVVESVAQVDWLEKHFGITRQTPSYQLRQHASGIPAPTRWASGNRNTGSNGGLWDGIASKPTAHKGPPYSPRGASSFKMASHPTKSMMSMWGNAVQFDKI